jgi:hypothetical protein
LLKTKKAKTVTEAAEMIGRNRVTVQDWLGKYRQGGLEKLLSKKVSTGRPRKVPQWAEKALEKRLKEKECFQIFLELVSEYFADIILIIQLDNGRFHNAKNLKIPDNIILMFQPPHYPESNPIEQI